MKKIFLLYLLTFGFVNAVKSQSPKDIVGAYNLRGGLHFVKPDHTFVIIAYATLMTGTWELQDKGLVYFVPNYEKNRFTLYGRHNKNIADRTKILLSYGFYEDETLLHFGPLKNPVPEFKRIFKPGHRHISFPYVYTKNGNSAEVSFTYFPYSYEEERTKTPEIYTFINNQKFNDFIGYYHEVKEDFKPFYYKYQNGKLFYDKENYSEKRNLESETQAIETDFRYLIENSNPTFSPKKIFSTPLYNSFEVSDEDLVLNFKFNAQKNAWLNILNDKNDEELAEDNDYHKVNIIFEYHKVENFSKKNSIIKIDETPIFISEYED